MIRSALDRDAAAIAAIYNHYVLETTITFEEQAVSDAEILSRMHASGFPWLVLEQSGAVTGYACAKPWHVRSAYRYSVESTIFLHHEQTGRGHGQSLYAALLDELARRSVHRVVAVIALPNHPSVALHERLGFAQAGRLTEIGRKFDRWLDVGHWSLALPRAGVHTAARG